MGQNYYINLKNDPRVKLVSTGLIYDSIITSYMLYTSYMLSLRVAKVSVYVVLHNIVHVLHLNSKLALSAMLLWL